MMYTLINYLQLFFSRKNPNGKLWSIVLCLFLLTVASANIYGQKKVKFYSTVSRVESQKMQVAMLTEYAEEFSRYFPSDNTGHWKPAEFPHVDWQDRVHSWLSAIPGAQFSYHWNDSLISPVEGDSPLRLVRYPLSIDIALRHEGQLLAWMNTAWALNAGGIELMGCQILRIKDNSGLTARCLFTLVSYTLPT